MITKEMLVYVIKNKGKCNFPFKSNCNFVTSDYDCNNCILLQGIDLYNKSATLLNEEDPFIRENALRIWKERGYTTEELFEELL